MKLNVFVLAMRLLWREWRAAQWYGVFFALLLAITAVTALHFYTDRLYRGVLQQSATLLGGDLVVTSSSLIPLAWKNEAERLQLRTAEVWIYPSVVSVGNQLQLTTIQAVSATYPLLGKTLAPMQAYTAWVESRLFPLLSLHLNDQLTIGAAHFRVTHVLSSDIETLNIGWAIAPKILIRLADVPATRTVIPGSRVEYRLLLTGEKTQLEQFRQWILPQLNSSQRLLNISNQQAMLWNILLRTQNYIQLALLAGLMMSGVAIALSVQHYMRRHYGHVALWRCLGAKKNHILQITIYQIVVIALMTGGLGVILGYCAQVLFSNLFKDIFRFPLPSPSSGPIILGFSVSGGLLFLFAFPLMSELTSVSPLYIWRNEMIPSKRLSYRVVGLVIGVGLVYWWFNFSLLTLFFIDIVLLSVGFLYLLSLVLLSFIRRIIHYTSGVIRQGLSQFIYHPESVSLQIVGFTLVLMVIFLLKIIRVDLVESWQESLPKNAPNYFAINIAPQDLPNLQRFFQQQQINIAGIYPMIRGRLIGLNGKPIMTSIPNESRNHNALHRDLNLSWMWQFPTDNQIVRGRDWTKHDKGRLLISVENKLAQDLRLKMGDELTFQLGSETVSAKIINFRSVTWSSFHPNFFIIFAPGAINHFPTTYITSFHLPAHQTILLNRLIQQFPNITIIDLANVLNQVLNLIGKITQALQYIFLFSLGTAILIFITSLQVSMDERRQTYRLYRVLGASRQYIYQSLFVEFISFMLVILVASMVLAGSIAWLLKQIILE